MKHIKQIFSLLFLTILLSNSGMVYAQTKPEYLQNWTQLK